VEDFAAEIGLQDFVVRTDAPGSELASAWRRLAIEQAKVRTILDRKVDIMRTRLRGHAETIVRDLTERRG